MPQGSVSWFHSDKGYGFLTPDEGGPDVFVHIRTVEGGHVPQEGARVEFDTRQSDRGPQAEHVRLLDPPPVERPTGRPRAAGEVVTATMSWFDTERGFGFAAPDDGDDDVFVHISAVEGGVALYEGSRVELGVRAGDRGPVGEHVRSLDGPEDEVGYDGPAAPVVLTGTVSWFRPDKGFGFLVPDDVFVHGSAVPGGRLEEGSRVEFEVWPGERGPQAEQVRVVGGPVPARRGADERDRAPRRPAFDGPLGPAEGSVSWFNAEKGFGFLAPDDGGGDVFVHVSALREDAGYRTLQEGDRVAFDVVPGERGRQAADVRRVGEAPAR